MWSRARFITPSLPKSAIQANMRTKTLVQNGIRTKATMIIFVLPVACAMTKATGYPMAKHKIVVQAEILSVFRRIFK